MCFRVAFRGVYCNLNHSAVRKRMDTWQLFVEHVFAVYVSGSEVSFRTGDVSLLLNSQVWQFQRGKIKI